MKIIDYTQMTLKELEKEQLKENQKLLDMMMDVRYQNDSGYKVIAFQKRLVDNIYKMISKKHNKIKKHIG